MARELRPARQAALDFLARREHSAAELSHKLVEKGYAAAGVTALIATLTTEGLISDARFCEAFTNARRARGYGPLYIVGALREKGVSDELIQTVVAPRAPVWRACVEQARIKKFGKAPPRDAAAMAKQIRFLQQRGFSYEHIRQTLNSHHDD